MKEKELSVMETDTGGFFIVLQLMGCVLPLWLELLLLLVLLRPGDLHTHTEIYKYNSDSL